ncbi:hypothetical protein QYF36_001111 [Acer negundo]|nr:hypothetical protein QYF36_001111 [Acer negundo]
MEKSSEEQMKPPENVTGNAAPASIDGDGASSLSCAVTAAVTTKAKRTKAKLLLRWRRWSWSSEQIALSHEDQHSRLLFHSMIDRVDLFSVSLCTGGGVV